MKIDILFLCLAFGGLRLAAAETLVEVNFDDDVVNQPPPLLNSTPPATLPSNRLVGMNFGQLLVVDQVEGMNQAVKFSTGGYCQPQVFLGSLSPTTATRFLFEFDFLLSSFYTRGPQYSSSVDEFTVFFDLPQAIRMNFQTTGSTGRISVGAGATVLGSFAFDTPHHLAISLDVAQQQWSAFLDNSPVFSNMSFRSDPSAQLAGVRLNLADDLLLSSQPLAYVDNIRLVAVPEPQPLFLTLVAGAAVLYSGRRLMRRRL